MTTKPSTAPAVARHLKKLKETGGGPIYVLLPPEVMRKLDALVQASQTSKRAVIISLILGA
jgi:hypothetical protein